MFNICPSFKALFTCAAILFMLTIIELHGLKCKRARKAEWANDTESLDSLCPYRKGTEERCYVLNCSDGNSHRADWGCVADFGDAHFQCPASCFNANSFACKCLLGAAGVDMSNENMNILNGRTFEKALPYDDDNNNEYNYNYYNYNDFYNYDAFDYEFHCDHDDFHSDYADIGCSVNVYGHGCDSQQLPYQNGPYRLPSCLHDFTCAVPLTLKRWAYDEENVTKTPG
uniref:Uncharacterized protein n=1 Tax=Globodera rostochiensis TaxID=31243 RepID=A0A914H9Y8_GLORO